MLITVKRYLSTAEATLSKIYIDGVFECFGLEDGPREVKVPGETRIPAGVYRVGVRREGGFHRRYSNDRRTRDYHRGMLHVLDVPGFQWILIHIGNFEWDTDGCLLVGGKADEQRMCVYNSALAYEALYKRAIAAAERGSLRIEYLDADGAEA